MHIKLLFLAAVYSISFSVKAQTLFTYANKKVTVAEFTRAYKKIYPEGTVVNKEKTIREYFDLYINSKLKIHQAYQKRYDTIPAFVEELKSLRLQLAENHLADSASYSMLLDEAFLRSQKDIQVQHIFIPYKIENNVSDSALAKLKINEAYMELVSGKAFDDVAIKFSADPAVNLNKGNVGFITAFSLPYQFENIIYELSPGKFSSPYKSKTGYHIFKNISERKAIGKIKAAQILLAFPPGSDADVKNKYALLADSLYQRLSAGDDFVKLSGMFSNDYVSAASGGLLPEFSIGTYDPVFENAIISLHTDGAISKPFLTSHGYHIVKRIAITPVISENEKAFLDDLKSKLDKDSRIKLTKDILIRRVINKAGFKQADISLTQLKAYTDSLVENKKAPPGNTLKNEMVLFKTGNQTKTIGDLVAYMQNNQFFPDGSGLKSFDQLMEEFKQITVTDYYKTHIEEYDESFSQQMNELKDGNLFFDIMMKEVWNKAQNDSAGQMNFYKTHIKKYNWQNSADAIVFYCGDEETAKNLKEAVSKNPEDWKKAYENFGDRSTIDSSRLEITKIPGLSSTTPVQGMVTSVEKNSDDNSASFAYILKIYNLPSQKSFAEAKGDVINDYQAALDLQWVNSLKKKYPVVINQQVLSTLIK
jgi:peptidyl-prolyl cis-trans isomerase SurA